MSAATIVSGTTLVELVLGALAAALGVTIAFSLVIYGATRAGDMRRAERAGAAAGYVALAALALAASAAIVAYGLFLTVAKSG